MCIPCVCVLCSNTCCTTQQCCSVYSLIAFGQSGVLEQIFDFQQVIDIDIAYSTESCMGSKSTSLRVSCLYTFCAV